MPNDLYDMTNSEIIASLRWWADGRIQMQGLVKLAADRLEALMQERNDLDSKLKSVQRAARNIHDINAKLINDSGKVCAREKNVDAQIEGVQAANAILTEEIERLKQDIQDLNDSAKADQVCIHELLAEKEQLVDEAIATRRDFSEAASITSAYQQEQDRLVAIIAEKSEALIRQRLEHNARVDELIAAHKEKDERRQRAEDTLHNMVENTRVNALWGKIPYSYSIQRGGMISE